MTSAAPRVIELWAWQNWSWRLATRPIAPQDRPHPRLRDASVPSQPPMAAWRSAARCHRLAEAQACAHFLHGLYCRAIISMVGAPATKQGEPSAQPRYTRILAPVPYHRRCNVDYDEEKIFLFLQCFRDTDRNDCKIQDVSFRFRRTIYAVFLLYPYDKSIANPIPHAHTSRTFRAPTAELTSISTTQL